MPTQGELLRDNALDDFELRYDNWLREARRAAWKWARQHGTVTADDVHRLTPIPPWIHHNCAGAVFRSEHFRQVGFINSTRAEARARTIRVYEIVRRTANDR
jgi:hypothetical protein